MIIVDHPLQEYAENVLYIYHKGYSIWGPTDGSRTEPKNN